MKRPNDRLNTSSLLTTSGAPLPPNNSECQFNRKFKQWRLGCRHHSACLDAPPAKLPFAGQQNMDNRARQPTTNTTTTVPPSYWSGGGGATWTVPNYRSVAPICLSSQQHSRHLSVQDNLSTSSTTTVMRVHSQPPPQQPTNSSSLLMSTPNPPPPGATIHPHYYSTSNNGSYNTSAAQILPPDPAPRSAVVVLLPLFEIMHPIILRMVWQRLSVLVTLLLFQSASQLVLELYEDMIAANVVIPSSLRCLLVRVGTQESGSRARNQWLSVWRVKGLTSGPCYGELTVGVLSSSCLFVISLYIMYWYYVQEDVQPTPSQRPCSPFPCRCF